MYCYKHKINKKTAFKALLISLEKKKKRERKKERERKKALKF
jgi:hypothetical protein